MTTISKQNNSSNTSEYGGMVSLGMVVIQKLVELIGGRIRAESELGKVSAQPSFYDFSQGGKGQVDRR